MSESKEPDEKLCIAVAKAAAKALENWDFTGPIEQAYQAYMKEVVATKQPDDMFYLAGDRLKAPTIKFYLGGPDMEPILDVEVDLFTALINDWGGHEPDQEQIVQALELLTDRLKLSFKERFGREPTPAPRD